MKKHRLDVNKKSDKLEKFEEYLKSKVIGQEIAISLLTDIYKIFLAGFQKKTRPLSNVLLLGPTGVGKTLICETVADFFDVKLVKVNCSELSESHTVAHLTGSPPGYVSREDPPLITKEMIEKTPSVVLFDELEKAHPRVFDAMLGIMDKAELHTNKGDLNLHNCFIFFTSNVGSEELAKLHQGMGFQNEENNTSKNIEAVSLSALKKQFKPEFINRLDKTIVFNTLGQEELRQILNIELGYLQGRIMLSNTPFVLLCTQPAKRALIEDGYDPKYGARHITRSLEKNIVSPLAAIATSGQLTAGDIVEVQYDGDFIFQREPLAAVAPVTKALEAINPPEKKSNREISMEKHWPFSGGY